MPSSRAKSVDEYISSQPEATQRALEQVRNTIRKALPQAEEVISYSIPAYRLHRRIVLYFAGWTEHYSLYPVNERLLAEFGDELARYKLSKGTIRFPLSERVPTGLIGRVAKFRAKEAAERLKTKRAGKS